MSETKTTTQAPAEKQKSTTALMEYVPFGGKDPIKLGVQIVKTLLAQPTKQGHQCSDADAMRFMMMCQARRLNPFEGDAFLIGYDSQDGPKFNLITAQQAFLKRAEVNPEFDGMESGVMVRVGDSNAVSENQGDFVDDGETLVGGWAKVFFKNRSKPIYRRLKLSRFKKDTKIWREDPAGMIVKCAEADALRSSFPTMLGGLYLREELDNQIAETNKVTPMFQDRKSDQPAMLPEPEKPKSKLASIQLLCEKSEIKMQEVEAFMRGVGMIGEVDGILKATEENLHSVITNWDLIVSHVMSTRPKEDGENKTV